MAQGQRKKITKENVTTENVVDRSASAMTGNKHKILPVIKPNQ